MMSQVNATVVRVSAFSVPYGDRGGISHALAYCIIECTGPIEAHGIAIVPSAFVQSVIDEIRSIALVGKSVEAVTALLTSSATSNVSSSTSTLNIDKLSEFSRAVLVDAAWSLRCGASAWVNAVIDMGPRAISNCCDSFDRLNVHGFTRGALEAHLRARAAADLDASSSLRPTFVLTETMCTANRLERILRTALEQSFTTFCVPIALGGVLDVARVGAVRALVGAACTIEVDAHGQLPPATAAEAVERLASSAGVVRVLRPFAVADVVEHRALQARLDAANVAVAVVPGSCASPLVAKQFIGEPTIRELAIEWCHESTLSTLLTTLCLCAMSNKPVRLLSETQLDTLVGWQLAALATRMLGTSSAAFGFCDEDEAHRFNNVAELRDGALGWPHAAGVSGGLTTQAFVEFNVTQQLSQQQQQQQQQYNNGGDSSSLNVKRARVDDVSAAPPPPPNSHAMPPPPPPQAFDPYAAASQNNNAMSTSNYGASVPAVATSASGAGGTSQCFGCKQFGHMVRDCPVAQASGRSDMCFQCGQPGHWASACPRRMPKGVCYNCGSAGHMSPACPQRPAGVAASPQGHIRCYVCQQYGHAAKNCPSTQQQGQFFR